MSDQQNIVAKVKLDKNSAAFFAHAVKNGLATFKKDPNLGEGESHAVISKDNGNHQISIHSGGELFVLSLVSDS